MIKPIAVTETGVLHQREGAPCQDAVLISMLTPDRMLAVLSDGAGSKQFGGQSAKLLTEWTTEYFQKTAGQIFPCSFDSEAFVAYINRRFSDIGLDHEDAGGTLMFLLLEGGHYLAGHIGDGLILCKNKRDISMLSGPENGETPNQTFFLPSESATEHLRVTTGGVPKGSAFLLTSDGDAPLLFDAVENTCAEACKRLFRTIHELSAEECEAFIKEHMQNLFSKYILDDQSMILVAYE